MADTWDGHPQNPERDGWHWVREKTFGEPIALYWYDEADGDNCFRWQVGSEGRPEDLAKHFVYLGPCLTPAEVAARGAAAYKRGQEDMRERAAGSLNYHATRLRKEDEDNRGIPNGMGHSFEANAGDAWADGIRTLPIKEAPHE